MKNTLKWLQWVKIYNYLDDMHYSCVKVHLRIGEEEVFRCMEGCIIEGGGASCPEWEFTVDEISHR